jgi:16S rRNA G966 N2-methylase RsmD
LLNKFISVLFKEPIEILDIFGGSGNIGQINSNSVKNLTIIEKDEQTFKKLKERYPD